MYTDKPFGDEEKSDAFGIAIKMWLRAISDRFCLCEQKRKPNDTKWIRVPAENFQTL